MNTVEKWNRLWCVFARIQISAITQKPTNAYFFPICFLVFLIVDSKKTSNSEILQMIIC